jgi:hypothetical protein
VLIYDINKYIWKKTPFILTEIENHIFQLPQPARRAVMGGGGRSNLPALPRPSTALGKRLNNIYPFSRANVESGMKRGNCSLL